MAAYIWPLDLPQAPQKGFSESIGVNVLRTPMDLGAPKLRRRGARPDVLNANFIMSSSQVEILENFCKNTVRGTARFDFPHPRTHQQVEVRFIPEEGGTMFQLQYIAPEYWNVSMRLELLP